MNRVSTTVSMNNGSQSQSPAQGAGLFVVGGFSSVDSAMPSPIMISRTDPEKVPPNEM